MKLVPDSAPRTPRSARAAAELPLRSGSRTESGRGTRPEALEGLIPRGPVVCKFESTATAAHSILHSARRTPRFALRQAFTLMELLIAVVAFSIVLAAINAVFYGALHLHNRTVRSLDEALPMRQTLTILQRDLANLVAPGGMLSGSLQTTKTSSQTSGGSGAAGGSSTAMVPNGAMVNQPGQGSPDFYTSTGLIDETSTWGEVQRVAYYLLPSTNGTAGKDLYRSVTRNLLPSLQEQPVLTPLLTGVQSVFFFYHDGTQWQDTWDSTTQTPPLPKAIKVQITLAPEELGRPQTPPVELVVPLLVEAPTNQTAQATQP